MGIHSYCKENYLERLMDVSFVSRFGRYGLWSALPVPEVRPRVERLKLGVWPTETGRVGGHEILMLLGILPVPPVHWASTIIYHKRLLND